ncbi:phosphatidylinositol phosphatase PTPRQ isoform X3 [Neophocaena asiaeorientalis asiaeorientalis]|uniref:Phosphatidylinositol phosphatase PTPRQ isoform X3 n=1 Tax=Neophocaena asiaeorientalis asiaeorientalis TaxID=1706337 RepID=A0A341ASN3_NEOAA|nr:phosphatidylinositol phosphatase PTPRQ isoform X3 [Neophocaena asiaeorientalis asiaeorientalis]
MKKVATKPSRICGLTLKAVNTSSANLMWNPTETNFTHYKIYISNGTFAKEYLIWEMMTEHTVTDLTPGRIYNITVHRMSGNVEGSGTFIRVVAEPEKPEKLKAFNISAHSFSLHWSLPSGHVDGFHVDLVPDSGFVTIKDLGGGEYQVDVSNAVPGTRYDVTISSISATTYSLPVSRTVTTNVTKPGPPVFLAGERVGSAGILLSWNTPPNPNGRIISYVVKYKEVCPWMQATYTQVRAKPDSLEVLLTNLKPGTTYEIKVAAENSAGIGVFSDPFLFQTAESAPGKVVNLTVEAFNYSAVSLIWYLPRQPNGKITSFKISVKHARSGIVVKDVSIRVEDILPGKLPECIENNESFLWSTTSPSPTLGRVTPPSRTTYPSSMLPGRKISSVWKEPISFVVTHLRPYTTYLFEVSAVTTEAGYIDSTIVRTPESVPEGPPQNCVTGNITGKSFSVSWDPPTTVTGKFSYRVELYGPSGQILDNSTKDLKFVFTNLTPFTKYDVYVAAETSAGIGPKSSILVFTPPEVPGTVFDLQVAEVEATEISITWKKPRQPNGIINQYRVKVLVSETGVILENTLLTGKDEYIKGPMAPETVNIVESMAGLFEGSAEMSSDLYSIASVMYSSHPHHNFPVRSRAEDQPSAVGASRNHYIADIAAEQLSYVIRRLVPFTEHRISVSAFTIMGEGPPTVLNVRTREQVPSSIQVIKYKNISSSSILLYWDPPEYPNGKITHYTIYAMELDTNRAFQMTTIDNSFLITGLKKYTKYKMRVAASTSVGESSLSEANDIFVRTPEDEPESSPQDVEVIDVTASEISLKWSPPEKPNGIIVAYEVLYKNIDTLFMKNTSATSIILRDLKPYTLYNISVRSYTRFGHGNQLSLLSVRTSETVPDSAPENITYKNISSGEIELSFLPPNSPNGIIQKYTIYLKKSNGNEERTINTTSLTQNIKGLKKYTQYIIEVSASTLKGEGVRSAPISVLTEEDAPDSPPQDFSLKQLSGVTVKLSWQPPLEPNGIILYYTVYVWDRSSLKNINVTETSLEFSDLDYNVEYSAYVTASTRFGEGKTRSNIINFRTPEGAPSDPPKDVHYANLSSSSVLLFWTPPSKPNGIIQYYSVYYRNTSGTFVQNISGLQTEAKLVGLEPISTYSISISAFTKVGNGNQFSNVVKFTTQESVPDVVQNIQCMATSWQSALVKWDPPKKANGIITHYMITVERNATKISPQDHMYTFMKLLANTSYVFKIRASTSAGEGDESACNISTLPETVPSTPTNIAFSDVQSTSATLTWMRPDTIFGYFQNYKITTQLRAQKCREWESEECVEYQKIQYLYEADLTEETVYDLKKFRWYRFQVAASTNAGYGDASNWISTQTLPGPPDGPPENVYVVATSPFSINISWSEPAVITGPTFYLIDVKSVDSDEFNISLIKSNGENKTIEIKDLKIFTRYSVVITAFTGNISAAYVEGKSSAEVIVTTLESVPKDPPNNMTFQKIPDEVTKFQLTFLPPSQPNGNIQVYQALVYQEDDPTAVQIRNLSIIQKTDTSVIAMLEGLKGGHTYNISVYAINSAGAGPNVQMRITMDIKAPARPKTKPTPIYDATGKLLVTSTTITIRMPICYYNDDHGPIKNVQVLVAEAGAQHDGNVTKWYDAYFNKPRPYFTNEGFPNPPCTEEKTKFSGNEEIYIIGADNACMIPGNEDKICNGPLKPKKQYLFKFRATNVMGQFTDSDYSDPVKTLGEGLSERSVEIILSVTLCILSIILLGTAIFAFARIRQKQKEGGTYSPRDAEIIDTKFNLDQLITVADLELKDERLTRLLSYRKSIKPISKKSFLQHVEELCTNNNLKFQEEFSELPKFLQDLSSTDADLPWNRAKNRFPNIKPYNNNRVKLIADASIPGSDYINASYVSGYLCPNEFIATQGPLPGTVGDFWRMVWETRAKTLVMLTQCFEKGRIRCHQYWPEDNKPVTVFGDIVITKLMEDVQIDWTIRDLKIERHGDCMTIRQCNFTAWPEHGVPENSTPLVHFVKLVRASRAHDTTPMVVHCSAGVGRTGVFIALDHLTQHINDHDFVDIYGLVAELRSERMCMV